MKGLRGVGLEEADGGRRLVGGALGGERAGLDEEFFGEVEGGEIAVAEGPETEGHATGAAAGFDEGRRSIRERALDEDTFGFPKAEPVRGARVVEDRGEVVEVVADGGGGDFFLASGQGRRGRTDEKCHTLDDTLTRSVRRGIGTERWSASGLGALRAQWVFGYELAFAPGGDEHAVGVEFVGEEGELRVEG